MWDNDSNDILGLDVTPEMKVASDLLLKGAEAIAGYALPLKHMESTCALKCFASVRDHWNMSITDRARVMSCIEKCEEPMEIVGEFIETERLKVIDSATSCLERCNEDDEICANKCISDSITSDRIDGMVSRIRSKIDSFRY